LRGRWHDFLIQGREEEEQRDKWEEINAVLLNWRGLWAMQAEIQSRQLAMCV